MVDLRSGKPHPKTKVSLAVLASLLVACSGHPSDDGSTAANSSSTASGGMPATDTYDVASSLIPGKSAVAHDGQTLRHVLAADLIATIEGLTERIDNDSFSPTTLEDTLTLLEAYYEFDGQTSGKTAPKLETSPLPLQKSYDAIATGKALKEQLAGNSKATDFRDWTKQFVGWKDASIAVSGGSINSPEGLLHAYFQTLGKLAVDRENGVIPLEPGTNKPISVVHITATGLDLHELIEKSIELGVTYAQASDDLLDDDVAGRGLLSPNTQDGAAPFTVLGHAWDEAFGYFGAAHDYVNYSDQELASLGGRADWQRSHDSNGDGAIDLTREFNFGIAVTAAKRDLSSQDATDFTGEAFAAALAGRRLILNAGPVLTPVELTQLKVHRDAWLGAWERSLAATVLHELNESIALTERVGGANYDFYAHAGEWSELKGYALGLQFNPRKVISDADFAKLHELLGDKPVLANTTAAERLAYVTALKSAHELVRTVYGFSKANAGAW